MLVNFLANFCNSLLSDLSTTPFKSATKSENGVLYSAPTNLANPLSNLLPATLAAFLPNFFKSPTGSVGLFKGLYPTALLNLPFSPLAGKKIVY